MPGADIGIIGGSGLYDMEGLANVAEHRVSTPFGEPSDAIVVGNLDGTSVAFLPRHGRGHRVSPTELNQRANIWAMKSLGVERLISVSAVGSLREDVRPLDLVIPNQLVDRTRNRVDTFFAGGIVAHVGMADPFCPEMSSLLFVAAQESGATVHRGGTYVVIEGPQFSTKAESRLYRSWGMDIIGMTALPEARLAREAELCYATIACVTDYDVWHESEGEVTVDMVIRNLLKNVATSKDIIISVVPRVPRERACRCGSALEHAIITAPDRIAPEAKERLKLLVGKYL